MNILNNIIKKQRLWAPRARWCSKCSYLWFWWKKWGHSIHYSQIGLCRWRTMARPKWNI